MDAPIAENKMADSHAAGESALQASVSFGRFANDSISSEKWSNFPTNKNLEEVEKCSSAGSVAQKKAYFEAHYKNIAARKAELEDKEKKRGTKTKDASDSEQQTRRASCSEFKAAEQELNADNANSQNCANVIEVEIEVQNSSFQAVEPKDVADEKIESKEPLPLSEDVKDESFFRPGTPELCKSEEPLIVKEEAPLGSERVEESPQIIDVTRASDEKEERDKVKSEKPLKSQKVTSAKKAASTSGVKKTAATSSTPKSSVKPNPKLSTPALSKSISPMPKALSKKENSTSSLTSKEPSSVKSRRVAPASLHMSHSLEPGNSERDMSTAMRKSLIMERMGDKDIVKRAFKAFRSNCDQLSSPSSTEPSAESEIPGKATNTKTSIVGTPPKKTEGGNKLVKKSSPLSSQTKKTSNSTRTPNTFSADSRDNKSVSSTYGNKASKKVEDRVNGKAAERTQLPSKEKKELEVKKLQNSCNTKTKPISGTFASKSSSHKGIA